MVELRELPAAAGAWLHTNQIPLGTADLPQDTARVWAEWDNYRGILYLGWWGEMECPCCHQEDRSHWKPLVPPPVADWSWQHGCGQWWEPEWNAMPLPVYASDETVRDALDVALGVLVAAQDRRVERLRIGMMFLLRGFLDMDDEQRAAVPKGSEVESGVWHDGEGWQVWLDDPRADDATITVTEADLVEAAAGKGSDQRE